MNLFKNHRAFLKANSIYIALIIFGLTPLIWFIGKDGILINGVDTNFPLDPVVWFQRRFFVWNSVSNAGQDFSSSVAGLFFHSVQFLPFQIGLGLQAVQKIDLIFWFAAIVFSAFSFSRLLLPKKAFAQLLFVSFYTFNIYIFNTWENVKVANLALVAAVPFTISILLALKENKISYIKAALYSIPAGIILSGAGINPAYFATFFIILAVHFFTELISDSTRPNITKRLKDILLVALMVFAVNLFWVIPTGHFIFANISSSDSIGSLGFSNWVKSLSENTSLVNVLRLQGAWDWYAIDDQTGLPFYIPYALVYFKNPFFIIFSFLIPILALASFILRKQKVKQPYAFFGTLFILGAFLGAGAHEPTGSLFLLLADKLPFFSLFRSPWYIFTPLLVLALSGLIGLLFDSLEERVKEPGLYKYRPMLIAIALALVIGNLLYTYPLISGKIFRPQKADGFYVNFPSYVVETGKWLKSQPLEGRLIGYPDDPVENFTWGYRGIDSILHLVSDKEVIFSPLNTGQSQLVDVINGLYKNLRRGQMSGVRSIAAKLDVNTVFEKTDQDSNLLNLPSNFKSLPKVQIGAWNFYELEPSYVSRKIYSSGDVYFGYPYSSGSEMLGVMSQDGVIVNPNDSAAEGLKKFANVHAIITAENAQLEDIKSYQSSNYKIGRNLFARNLSEAHFSFESDEGFYQPMLESYRLEDFGFDLTKGLELTVDGIKNVWDIESKTDSYITFKPQGFKKGKHEAVMNLKNKNLISNERFLQNVGKNVSLDTEITAENVGGFKYLSLRSIQNKDTLHNLRVENFNPLADYLVQVRYKHFYGYSPKIVLRQRINNEIVKLQIEQLPLSPEWDVYSFYYQSHNSNSDLEVSLEAKFAKENPLGTKVAFADLSVVPVFTNNLFMVKKSEISSIGSAKVNFKKISPVEYEGTVSVSEQDLPEGVGNLSERGQVIVFSENYSPDWEMSVYDNKGLPLLSRITHFSANLYANAWYVQGAPESYKFKIFYKPQRLFLYGSIASIVIPVGVLLGLLYFKNGRSKKTN